MIRDSQVPHTCQPDRDLALERQLRHDILDTIRDNRDVFQQTVFVATRVRARYPPHVAARVTGNRMRSAIRRAADPLHLPRIPDTIEELSRLMGENPHITATMDGADDIFLGMVGPAGHRSLVFMSRRVVPFCQVLMQTRTRIAYIPALEAIQLACPNFQPRLVVTDFEPAMMQAWVHVFRVEVQGCFWHFSRAVTITSRTMGLTGFLNVHDRARSIVRSLLALPLLPRDLIGEGFMSLAYEAADEGVYAVLHQFFLNIHSTWLTGFRYEMLSVFLAVHRTNNVSESANRMLRLRTHVHHPNISTFLDDTLTRNVNSSATDSLHQKYSNPHKTKQFILTIRYSVNGDKHSSGLDHLVKLSKPWQNSQDIGSQQ
ncbi:Tyrosine-protein kinase etk [Frankliniella fusca]|uniref:Tyrosine-protein kinase etk n=1 Tax=Frankliniella fusca TaxID=407009 RepID=A0AAE1HLI6_9NEOP|nr:Tyrosine-protein kinase etk [Frankliniella fusca]